MRKNGVCRTLRKIRGGICAVEGFQIGGSICGMRENGAPDLALILADKRCPTACVFSRSQLRGAPNVVNEKHLQNGYAQAIVINSGAATTFLQGGERLAKDVCALVSKYYGVLQEDVLTVSVGEVGKPLSLSVLDKGLQQAPRAFGREEFNADLAARVMASDGEKQQLFSYSFAIGDYFCRIGGVCAHTKEGATLVFLATNVGVSPEMLQKALSAECKETIELLHTDGLLSPNDIVCIMANGKAGNSMIDRPDTEFKKFGDILYGVLTEVCRLLAAQSGKNKVVYCKVTGAKSKQISRALARLVVGNLHVKRMPLCGKLQVEHILYMITEICADADISTVRISVCLPEQKAVIYEEGKKIPVCAEWQIALLQALEIGIEIELSQGNYASVAYGSACANAQL